MQKHYTLFCALLAAAMAMPASAHNNAGPAKQQNAASLVSASNTVSLVSANTADADDTKDVRVLIDEDFSGLTDGTEDNPSDVNLLNDLGDFSDESMLKPYSSTLSYKKWGGGALYAAGGCAALKDGWFLNTPAGDMSGDITLTFRARLAKGQGVSEANGALKLLFLSRRVLVDYETKFYNLTDEWQTFTFKSNRGQFEETGFQFMSMLDNYTILLDDIRVEQVQTSIPAPEAKDAEDAGDYSFKAVWAPSDNADYYLLDVYSKSNIGATADVSEGFDGINADSDGNIDATSPNYPSTLNFAWKDNDLSNRVASGAGTGTGNKQALRLVGEGDEIATPYCKEGITAFKVWVKAEANGGEPSYESYLQFDVDTDYGLQTLEYVDTPNMFTPSTKDGYYVDLTEAMQAFGVDIYSVSVKYVRGADDATTVLIDDLSYSYIAPPTLNYVLKDKKVTAAEGEEEITYNVDGLDAEQDYYYTVKAANDKFVSEPSDEIEVFAVSQPVALPATDVTANGYTAHWNCNHKADYYRVEQVQQTTLDKDADDYEILYEDFSKVTSDWTEDDLADFFYEEGPQATAYMPIDDLTQIAGWKATSTIRVNGWLGGNAAQTEGAIAGAIVTPKIDLSHNDGECKVKLRAWGYVGDWIIIQGINAAALATIEIPEGGFVETTVNIPLCTSKEQLTFYSNNYQPFLIDYIKIMQNVKAGEKVSTITAAVLTDDADTKQAVMDNPGFGDGHDIYYKVTAMRYFKDGSGDYMASDPSDLMLVPNPNPTGISTVGSAAESIKATRGGVVVNVAEATSAEVYNMAGQIAASKACGNGHTFIALAPGVYVVKTAHNTAKVVVK